MNVNNERMSCSFMNLADINNILNEFAMQKQWTWRLVFVFSLFLQIRINDILNLRWNNFYGPDGTRKEYLEVREEKTGQMTRIWISSLVWKEINLFCNKKSVEPSEDNYKKYVFIENDRNSNKIRAAYRRTFKRVVELSGIDYPASIYSVRKILGYYGRDKDMDKKEWEELFGIIEEKGIVEEEDLEEEEEVKEDGRSL